LPSGVGWSAWRCFFRNSAQFERHMRRAGLVRASTVEPAMRRKRNSLAMSISVTGIRAAIASDQAVVRGGAVGDGASMAAG
jgi:hypothetical protein